MTTPWEGEKPSWACFKPSSKATVRQKKPTTVTGDSGRWCALPDEEDGETLFVWTVDRWIERAPSPKRRRDRKSDDKTGNEESDDSEELANYPRANLRLGGKKASKSAFTYPALNSSDTPRKRTNENVSAKSSQRAIDQFRSKEILVKAAEADCNLYITLGKMLKGKNGKSYTVKDALSEIKFEEIGIAKMALCDAVRYVQRKLQKHKGLIDELDTNLGLKNRFYSWLDGSQMVKEIAQGEASNLEPVAEISVKSRALLNHITWSVSKLCRRQMESQPVPEKLRNPPKLADVLNCAYGVFAKHGSPSDIQPKDVKQAIIKAVHEVKLADIAEKWDTFLADPKKCFWKVDGEFVRMDISDEVDAFVLRMSG